MAPAEFLVLDTVSTTQLLMRQIVFNSYNQKLDKLKNFAMARIQVTEIPEKDKFKEEKIYSKMFEVEEAKSL